VIATLAAGSAVILKPAPETVLTAWHLASCLWGSGVPKQLMPFVPTGDDDVGQRLVTHEDVGGVILTAAFATARMLLGWWPELSLHAETSDKNTIVVTSAVDQDDTIRDLMRSAFTNANQKCSAASLEIVEADLYDDNRFLDRFADAASSLLVSPASDPATQVGPLSRPPSGALERALTTRAPGERWLVEPRQVGDNPHLWSPGAKVGVRPGSELHLDEVFEPVLGVMRAKDLDEAVALQNATDYGLTGGIHTLDDSEVTRWRERVEVGNAYVNRHITGAIVRRQPFGGWSAGRPLRARTGGRRVGAVRPRARTRARSGPTQTCSASERTSASSSGAARHPIRRASSSRSESRRRPGSRSTAWTRPATRGCRRRRRSRIATGSSPGSQRSGRSGCAFSAAPEPCGLT
jgi:RHH-type proline utilization regulon transcriptional repressor/proline dehydrogenase/delta 1-pyrroline-5-carboxylate dehydrogenase